MSLDGFVAELDYNRAEGAPNERTGTMTDSTTTSYFPRK